MPAIKVEGLGKSYLVGHSTARAERYTALRDVVARNVRDLARKTRDMVHGRPIIQGDEVEEFWALKDVSFEVEQGETLGIIGRNGAGKSTLLKVLSRITEPTKGRITLQGRVASLLEVGTGFHPELTGRENIFLNGAILGMTRREIQRRFDEIVAFAEVEQFLDTPVKRYSSGMYVRLAFAVAAHLEPEILIIDEVLAVGDAAFQKKCLGKMGSISKQGLTVLFVSHQLDMIRAICERCLLLKEGNVLFDTSPEMAIDQYLNISNNTSSKTHFEIDNNSNLSIQILGGRILNNSGLTQDQFDVYEQIIIEIKYAVNKPVQGAIVNFELKKNGSDLFWSFDTDKNPELLDQREIGAYICRVKLPSPLLKPGTYQITMGTGIANSLKIHHVEDALHFEVDFLSASSSFLSFSSRRSGSIALSLDWYSSL